VRQKSRWRPCRYHKLALADEVDTNAPFVLFTPDLNAGVSIRRSTQRSLKMHPDTRQVAAHMKEFGLALLGRCLQDVTFDEICNPYAHAMGVVSCARSAEIIIKARIAEEHPLLIFNKLPRPDPTALLDVRALMNDGQTLSYKELPAALWAATGYHIGALEDFQNFGRLRNNITHFAVPNIDLSSAVYRFAFQVVEPIIYDLWEVDIIECYEEFGEEEGYIFENLGRLGITFTRRACGSETSKTP
jgi:hypothetical protein